MVWVSYGIAIFKDPGTTPRDFKPDKGQWKRWCKKCEAYKPERAHHCKTCKKCIPKMDHHCPWTANCVGYDNMPHFMRFLYWVIFTTGFVLVELFKRGHQFYQERNYPAYMFRRSELVFTLLLLPMDGFVLLSVGLLCIKCLVHITSGMSQIETWEWERIETQLYSERFWARIRKNYAQLHGKRMPRLRSIRLREYPYYESTEHAQALDHYLFSIDDIVFPYDVGFWSNVLDQLNYPWLWLIPWSGPKGDGIHYEKSDLLDEDQLGLPWPPDNGNQIEELDLDDDGKETSIVHAELKNPRLNVPRTAWVNDLGENLTDYGVDLEVEAEDQLETIRE